MIMFRLLHESYFGKENKLIQRCMVYNVHDSFISHEIVSKKNNFLWKINSLLFCLYVLPIQSYLTLHYQCLELFLVSKNSLIQVYIMEKHTRKIPTAMKTYDCTGVFAVYLLAGSKLYAVIHVMFIFMSQTKIL